MRKKALLIEEREIQVINWFQIRLQRDNDKYATSYEIAKGLGLSASSHLRKILAKMVEKRALESASLERSGRWPSRGYRLKRGTFKRPPKQMRAIPVNSRKGTEQMELF
jgi:hypothetical protein